MEFSELREVEKDEFLLPIYTKILLWEVLFIDANSGKLTVSKLYDEIYGRYEDVFSSFFFEASEFEYGDSEGIHKQRRKLSHSDVVNLSGMADYIVKCFLNELLVCKNFDVIDSLLIAESDIEKKQKFFVLMKLTQIFYGGYRLYMNHTGTEFWHRIHKGEITDPIFEGFHYINYFTEACKRKNAGDEVVLNYNDIRNFYGDKSHLATEDQISLTNDEYMNPISRKLVEATYSPFFDDLFIEFFEQIKKAFPNGDKMLNYIRNSTNSSHPTLIADKLESLGFMDK